MPTIWTKKKSKVFPKWLSTCADSVLFGTEAYKASSSPLVISCDASEDNLRSRFAEGTSPSISPTYKIEISNHQ